MRILYYSPHPTLNLSDPSGYGTHMRQMIQGFRNLGHEVVTLIAGGEQRSEKLLRLGSESNSKKLVKRMVPRYLWESMKDFRLRKFDRHIETELDLKIQELRPDLVYERANYLQTSGVQCAAKYGVRHFLEINSPYVEERVNISGSSAFLRKGEQCESVQMNGTNQIIVVSSALKKHFQRRHKVEPDKIQVIPNAVNPSNLVVDQWTVRSLRQQWQLKGKTVIGFVGAIFPWHGVDVLLRAVADITRRYPELRVLIVGGGLYLNGLQDLARNLGIEEFVVFTDNVASEEVPAYISLMDIAVAPRSGWYQSPIKIFEYGGLRRPIVAHDTVPARDVMVDRIDGLLVESSESAIAAAIEELLANDSLCEKLAAVFHKKVMSKYTWDHAAGSVVSAYESLFHSKGAALKPSKLV